MLKTTLSVALTAVVGLSPAAADAALVTPVVGFGHLPSAPIALAPAFTTPSALVAGPGPLGAAPAPAPSYAPTALAAPAAAAVPAPALASLSAGVASASDGPRHDAPAALSRAFDGGAPRFEQSLQGPYSFSEVEFVRRNHAVGLYYSENLTLRPWTAVSDEATLGVDAKGRAFHVLQLSDRKVGYLLSGQRRMKALFLSGDGHLFAVDAGGRLLQYGPEVWSRSAWPQIVRKTLGYYALSVVAAVAAAAAAKWAWSGGFPAVDGATWAVAAFGSIASLMSWGAYALNRWQHQNEMTDGFVPVGGKVGALHGFDRVGDDYRLHTETGVHSLRELVLRSDWRPEVTEDFGVQDKHEKLPRGIDPKTYEPVVR